MVPHPHDDGPVERGVSLSMPAAVEAVAARCHPGRSRDGAGPAELGEGGFRMNPIGVVAKDDQHLGGGVGTDAQALTQRRRGLGCESTQVTVVVHDLDGGSEPATGERPEGMFRRGGRRIDRAAAPSAASIEERLVGERVEGFSQLGRRGDDDLLQRDHRRGAGFDRRPARDLEVAHHLDRPVRGLRDGGRLASQDRPRGGLGIHGVGLPGDSTGAPVAPVHFEHLVPGSPDRARESRPVAAGAFDAERGDASVTLGPGDQLLVAV